MAMYAHQAPVLSVCWSEVRICYTNEELTTMCVFYNRMEVSYSRLAQIMLDVCLISPLANRSK